MGDVKPPDGSEKFRKETMQAAGRQFGQKLKEMGVNKYIGISFLQSQNTVLTTLQS